MMTSFIIKKGIETMRIFGSTILNKVNVFQFCLTEV